MELKTAVRDRRSIRRFLSKPVPDDLIREIITDALWSPSWGNTQPWEIIAVTGEALNRYRQENAAALAAGQAADTDVPVPEVWPDALKDRYRDIGKRVLSAMEIARGDVEGRTRYYQEMFAFFDAPVLLMFVVDRSVSLEYAMLDTGLILQTVCLLAHDRGLGTCILAASINYAAIARRILGIGEDRRIVIGTALGWPDTEATVNRFERGRGGIDDFLRWVT
jgi:nitroreductase